MSRGLLEKYLVSFTLPNAKVQTRTSTSWCESQVINMNREHEMPHFFTNVNMVYGRWHAPTLRHLCCLAKTLTATILSWRLACAKANCSQVKALVKTTEELPLDISFSLSDNLAKFLKTNLQTSYSKMNIQPGGQMHVHSKVVSSVALVCVLKHICILAYAKT